MSIYQYFVGIGLPFCTYTINCPYNEEGALHKK